MSGCIIGSGRAIWSGRRGRRVVRSRRRGGRAIGAGRRGGRWRWRVVWEIPTSRNNGYRYKPGGALEVTTGIIFEGWQRCVPCCCANNAFAAILSLDVVELFFQILRDVPYYRSDFSYAVVQHGKGSQEVHGRVRNGNNALKEPFSEM